MGHQDALAGPGAAWNHPVSPGRARVVVGGERTNLCAADPDTAELRPICPSVPARTAYAAQHPWLARVYGVDEAMSGTLTVFDAAADRLAVVDRTPSLGAIPCHVAVAPDGGHVLTANYGSGDVVVHRLTAAGDLAGVASCLRLPGPGSAAHPRRQDAPHPHQIVFTSTDTVTIVDLGTDSLAILRFAAGRLRPLDTRPVPAGTGPRHLCDRWLVGELDPAVFALPALTRYPLAAPGLPSAIVTSPDGKHVYAANRGPGTIAALSALPPHTAREFASGGANPQDLAFVGDVLYAAVPDIDAVTMFRRTADGDLRGLGVALRTEDPRHVLPLRVAPTPDAPPRARSSYGEPGRQTHR